MTTYRTSVKARAGTATSLRRTRTTSLATAATVAAFVLATAGCAGGTAATPFEVVIRGTSSSCGIEVDGREVTTDQLVEAAGPNRAGRKAVLVSPAGDAPYRCIGGAVYALQQAGFRRVEVVPGSLAPADARGSHRP